MTRYPYLVVYSKANRVEKLIFISGIQLIDLKFTFKIWFTSLNTTRCEYLVNQLSAKKNFHGILNSDPLKAYIPFLAKFQPWENVLEIFKAGSEIP